MRKEVKGSFQTIHRIPKILQILANYPEGLPLMTIVEELGGAPKSSIFVILRELVKSHYITYLEKEKKYKIGLALIKLSAVIMYEHTIQKSARSSLEILSKITGEDVYLGILDGDKMQYLDKVEGSQSIRVNIRIGSTRILHATAIGKLLLAQFDVTQLNRYLQYKSLLHYTKHTITDNQRLYEEMKEIREKGYAESKEEGMEGIYGIAAPVRNNLNEVIAGINIAAPVKRALDNREKFIQMVIDTAKEISEQIGAESND